MESTTKELRPYQVRLVTDVCRATEDVLVEQPTGSGKTVQIVTLVAMHLGRRFSHAVISAPQEQIEQRFVKRDYQKVVFPIFSGVAVPPIPAPSTLIKGARESQLGSVKRVIHYLLQPRPVDHAFACTHATLNRLTPEDLPADLSGKTHFIDEAHHASADGLPQIVALWREPGGQFSFLAATPYRGQGGPVPRPGMSLVRPIFVERMREGSPPGRLHSRLHGGIAALGNAADQIPPGCFAGLVKGKEVDNNGIRTHWTLMEGHAANWRVYLDREKPRHSQTWHQRKPSKGALAGTIRHSRVAFQSAHSPNLAPL